MVENYSNTGSSRRSFRNNSSQRGFDCRPQFQQQKSASLRNSCEPSTSAAAAAVRGNYDNCGCPTRKLSTSASSSPTRFNASTMPKMCSNDLNTGAGMLSSTPQAAYGMSRNSCGHSAASLVQDSCNNLSKASTASCCCCCPHCGKPQDPTQTTATTTTTCPPPKPSLPCRPKPQPLKEETPSPEVEFKCRMRKLQLENLVKDQYCPGAIQSTIDCEQDFNEASIRLVFGCDPLPCTLPTVEPISLLEAFAMRVELERCLLDEDTNYAEQRRSSRRGSNELDEVDEYFSKKYKTALNEALASFLKAERCYYLENPNMNALSMNAQINKTYTCLPSSSFKITAYTGNTRPNMQ
ncbi:uncharacterized protein [Bactrocera oleae]|uniref:uncharacterized protein n=1 Tax=Bactrocera oleae TaxID=104688 RepID=UPI00387EB6EF